LISTLSVTVLKHIKKPKGFKGLYVITIQAISVVKI